MAVTYDTTPLHERARGRWTSILPALGIDKSYLTGKNGPCPLCPGGRDRWRFDNKRGDGTWICSQCGAGQGVALALKYTKLPFRDVAARIERHLGEAPLEPIRAERSEQEKRAALNALWKTGRPIQIKDPVDRWLRGRGIGMQNYPKCLRTSMRVRHSGPPASWHPAMLAMVSDSSGKPATIHKTYVTADGKKAAVRKVRMFCPGSVPAGGAVRLATPGEEMGIAEGIETAFAAMQLFSVPTWAALSDGGVEKFEPPAEVRRLVIFGDNDIKGAGQRAAYALASRMSGRIAVDVRIPEQIGTDWNDVLRG
ncbi:putative DNA primase/helicase [Bradyrhizobium sp. F1.13.1]